MGIKRAYVKYYVMYYPKYHYELYHIKHSSYNGKSWTKKNCKYNIENLRKDILGALV